MSAQGNSGTPVAAANGKRMAPQRGGRAPVARAVVRALVSGFTSVAVGYLGIFGLVALNAYLLPQVPWIVIPGSLWLFLYWKWSAEATWLRKYLPGWSSRLGAPRREFWGAVSLASLVAASALIARILGKLILGFGHVARDSVPYTYDYSFFSMVVDAVFVTMVAPAIVEEVSFRGFMQTQLEAALGPWMAIPLTAAAFSLIHYWTDEPLLYFLPLGLILGFLTWLTNSLWPAIGAHAIFNGLGIAEVWMGVQPFQSKRVSIAWLAILVAVGCVAGRASRSGIPSRGRR